MFCDVDKVDIVYERDDGAQVGVQTDHRTAAEIREDLPRSLVFTLSRIIRPMTADMGLAEVEVVFPELPPPELREAVEVAGGRVRAGDEVLEPEHAADPARADAIAAAALEQVGRAALARFELEATEAGLHAYEEQVGLHFEDFGHWVPEQQHTAVLELAAAAGEVMRAVHGGTWAREALFEQDFPFTVERDGSRTNLFGRAYRFFEESVSDGPSVLLRSAGEGSSDGPILPVLRPPGFAGNTQSPPFGRPLLDVDTPEIAAEMPHIYLVQDRPESVMYLQDLDAESFDTFLEASYPGLASRSVDVERLADDAPVFILEGDYFAASKILDRRLLAGLAETADSPVLLVAVPTTRAAVVGTPEYAAGIIDIVRQIYEGEGQSVRLSPLVFAATAEAGIEGLVRLGEPADDAPSGGGASGGGSSGGGASAGGSEEEAPVKKPWWKKLFGK